MPNPITEPLVDGHDESLDTENVLVDATPEGVATVTLNRADKKNAFNFEMIEQLSEAFETLHGSEGVRVVFVRGAEGVFSAGADLEWMAEASELTEADNRADAMALAVMIKRLWDLPALTVALVEGPALGGGAGLVAACDMAIAAEGAQFGFSEVKLGLLPAVISPYVVNAIGPRAARRLFATGQGFDAAEARRLGLVDEVVPDAVALEAAAQRIAADMRACAPDAVALCKALVEDVAGREIDHGLMEETARRIAKARVSEEGREGVRAFLDRARPSWAE